MSTAANKSAPSGGGDHKPGPGIHSTPGYKSLGADLLAKQQKYPVPMEFDKVTPFGNAQGEEYKPLPAEYAYPSAQKEKFLMKMDMMRNAAFNKAAGQGHVNWAMSDSDVSVVQDLEHQRRLYEYHRYIDKHIDPRKPGNLEWLMRVEPDYIKMKMKALNTHMQLMEKKIRLRAFGVQDTDDLRMKFLIDTNQLQDTRVANDSNRYVRGFFGPRYNAPNADDDRSASKWTDMLTNTSWTKPTRYAALTDMDADPATDPTDDTYKPFGNGTSGAGPLGALGSMPGGGGPTSYNPYL